MTTPTCNVHPTSEHEVELERLGDEIAELCAHLDAATARLLDLIRDFDARGGRGNGFMTYAIDVLHPLACRPASHRPTDESAGA
jgi:hypothetical protein